jgi:parallel beta-helix repeat protein
MAGKTYYISGNGNDSNNGLNKNQAFKTFDQVQKVLKAGDTVYVMNGTYTQSDTNTMFFHVYGLNGSAKQWTTIKAYPGHNPVLKIKQGYGIVVSNSSYVRIEGLTLEGNRKSVTLDYAEQVKNDPRNPITNNNGISISAVEQDGKITGPTHHIVISGNTVRDFSGGGIGTSKADYVTIENNTVSGNAWYTSMGSQAITNLHNWNSDNNTKDYKMIIRGNIIYDNQSLIPWVGNGKRTEGNGIIIDTSNNQSSGGTGIPYTGKTLIANNVVYNNGGAGILAYKSDNVDIFNNTTYKNAYGPEQPGEIEAVQATNIRAFNNIMYATDGKATGFISPSSKNVVFDRNLAYNGSFKASDDPNKAGLQNIVGQDPEFVNAAKGDFRLKAGSPAVDTGSSSFDKVVPTDRNGNKRRDGDGINGVQTDIGANEYTGTATKTPAIVFLSTPNVSKAEGLSGNTPFTYTLTRAGNTKSAVNVNYAVTPYGTGAAKASDFGGALPTGTVKFAANEKSKKIMINVSGDAVGEGDEGFFLTLSKPSQGAVIGTATAQGTILNDDDASLKPPSFAIEAANAVKKEGNKGDTPFTFTITRSGNTLSTNTIDYDVRGTGTTTVNGADFGGSLPKGTVSFKAGETKKTITINVKGDTLNEGGKGGQEPFLVWLSNPSGDGSITTYNAVGRILNDDGSAKASTKKVSTLAVKDTSATVLNGTNKRDILVGKAASNEIRGQDGADRLTGGSGKDSLFGGNGNDQLLGGAGDDLLQGDAGNDTLLGGAGNDQLLGGAGDDVLTGGAGADTFGLVANQGTDRIRDFAVGVDKISLGSGLSLNNVLIQQQGSQTWITDSSLNQVLAKLDGVNAATLKSQSASTFLSA